MTVLVKEGQMPQQPALFMVMVMIVVPMRVAVIGMISMSMVIVRAVNVSTIVVRAMSMTVVVMHGASKAICTAMILVFVGMRARDRGGWSMIARGRGVCMQLVVIVNVVVGHAEPSSHAAYILTIPSPGAEGPGTGVEGAMRRRQDRHAPHHSDDCDSVCMSNRHDRGKTHAMDLARRTIIWARPPQ